MSPAHDAISAQGWCRHCGETHSLPYGESIVRAQQLMVEMESLGRLDYLAGDESADPALTTAQLLPGQRGHMFGVLECRDAQGATVWLRAFSSLGSGVRDIDGWAPPVLPTTTFEELVLPVQLEIKALTCQRNALPVDDPERQRIEARRRAMSRELMPQIHAAYRLRSLSGQLRPLDEIFLGDGGLPGGVGDCCAPKLLNHAAAQGLQPISLAEFFWGGSNASGRKQAGQFFPACEEKCQPILGYMLCQHSHE